MSHLHEKVTTPPGDKSSSTSLNYSVLQDSHLQSKYTHSPKGD